MLVMRVSGRSRVPSPPASTTPFILVEAPGRRRGGGPEPEPGERVEADVVPILGATAERPEADQRALHAEQALVGVRLVGDARLDQPAVATRDDAEEVVALEEVRAGRRCRTEIVSGEEREPQVATQTQVQGAIQLVHPAARQERRLGALQTHAPVRTLLDEPVRDPERG